MNTYRLQQARALFPHEKLGRDLSRKYIRQWVASIRRLGDKWLMAKRVGKL